MDFAEDLYTQTSTNTFTFYLAQICEFNELYTIDSLNWDRAIDTYNYRHQIKTIEHVYFNFSLLSQKPAHPIDQKPSKNF